jgi:L-seryl-tRNA(Ser) seleniumtransferase
MMMAGVEATAMAHLRGDAGGVPIVKMLRVSVAALRERAQRIVAAVGDGRIKVVEAEAQVGGGSLPRVGVASVALEVSGGNPQDLAKRLRLGEPIVVGYVAQGQVRLDLRAVFPRQDALLAEALRKALA